jgi:hypothetical protein
MGIELKCPTCGTAFSAGDEFAGRSVNCPACTKPVEVPGTSTSPVASAPSSAAVTVTVENSHRIRRSARQSFFATLCWCLGPFLAWIAVPVVGLLLAWLLAIGIFVGAVLQLRDNYKWLSRCKLLAQHEQQDFSRRLGWLTALIVFSGAVNVIPVFPIGVVLVVETLW